jgi:hypothetical protein
VTKDSRRAATGYRDFTGRADVRSKPSKKLRRHKVRPETTEYGTIVRMGGGGRRQRRRRLLLDPLPSQKLQAHFFSSEKAAVTSLKMHRCGTTLLKPDPPGWKYEVQLPPGCDGPPASPQ